MSIDTISKPAVSKKVCFVIYCDIMCEVLRSKNLIGKCTKLYTVVASNNRDHSCCYHQEIQSTVRQVRKHCYRSLTNITLLLLVHATYIWVLFFAYIPFVVNCTFNATPTQRLQLQYKISCFNAHASC